MTYNQLINFLIKKINQRFGHPVSFDEVRAFVTPVVQNLYDQNSLITFFVENPRAYAALNSYSGIRYPDLTELELSMDEDVYSALVNHLVYHILKKEIDLDQTETSSFPEEYLKFLKVDVFYTWDWDRSPEDIYDLCPTKNDIPSDAFDAVSLERLPGVPSSVKALKEMLAGNKLSARCADLMKVEVRISWLSNLPDYVADAADAANIDLPWDGYSVLSPEEVFNSKVTAKGALAVKKHLLRLLQH